MRHCYLCGSTDHSKKDCLKFVPLKRARGRRYSGEVEDQIEPTPINDNEDGEEIDDESAKTNTASEDEPPTTSTTPESPNASQTAVNITSQQDPTLEPKPQRPSKKLTKAPNEYAPFTRKTSKRPVPSTPEKNVVRKKPTGENS
eukprot:gene17850-biopygen48